MAEEERKGGLRIIRLPEVMEKLTFSESKVKWLIKAGMLPKPFQIVPGGRALGWLEGDIDEWIMEQAGRKGLSMSAPSEPEPEPDPVEEDETTT